MTPDSYGEIVRLMCIAMSVFFAMQSVRSYSDYRVHGVLGGLWHTWMCAATALYSLLILLSTLPSLAQVSDPIFNLCFVIGFLAYIFYLRCIDEYLASPHKFLKVAQGFCAIVIVANLVEIFAFCSGTWLFFSPISGETSLFEDAMHLRRRVNLLGLSVVVLGATGIVGASAVILRHLTLHRREPLLVAGVVLTLLASLNDMALGSAVIGISIPLYFTGNILEAVRFSQIFRRIARTKLMHLEKDVMELSTAAQIGVAASSIAHDVKSPLTVIKIAADRIVKATSESEDTRILSDAEKIRAATLRILDITTNYSSIFRGEKTEQVDCKLSDLFDECQEMTEQHFSKNGVELRLPDLSEIRIQSLGSDLLVCVVNLLINAADAAKQSANPWARVTCKETPGFLELHFVDSGPGVPAEHRDRIFEFRYTTKAESEGTGLGLAIVRSLLARNNMGLRLDEECAHTTFVISIPRERVTSG